MSNILTPEKRELLSKAVGEILYDTNRTIYRWKSNRNNRRYVFDYTEMKGMFNNWLHRHLKGIIGVPACQRLFRGGMPMISVDNDSGFITGIRLATPPRWAISSDYFDELQSFFSKTDYKLFFYDPSKDSNPIAVKESEEGPHSLSEISFDSINNIKF